MPSGVVGRSRRVLNGRELTKMGKFFPCPKEVALVATRFPLGNGVDPPCRRPAQRPAIHDRVAAFVTLSPRPKAPASRRRTLRPWSGSPASLSDGLVRQSHSGQSSESRRRGGARGLVLTWSPGHL